MRTSPNTQLGILFNIIASLLFALMFAYSSFLDSLQGNEIYGWRILLTFPCLTLFIVLQGKWSQVSCIYKRLYLEKYFIFTRLLSAFLIGFQLWLFMWAPSHHYGLDISLGYFIMPITMVIVGRYAFKEQLTKMQKLSCCFAIFAILNLLLFSQTLSWPTLAVCLGYPVYFWLRQKSNTNNIAGLWFDLLFSLPISLFFIINDGGVFEQSMQHPHIIGLILGLGLISALALGFQSLSAPHLNLSLFGLLVYVEPIFLLIVSIILGENIQPREWPTYIAIWFAVFVLMIEGLLSLRKTKH
ncbi:EamA family transporter RarD [Acinetobacter rudis]|uniref:EamA family transporter RarD n=1 Tax=Acinetobacter rudis TaxID=632955 RepID=UPI00281021C9|nr:EamA family transporter RarD [Acinetobacter rudis]MDQ8952206.1 EamA family transporter RarD [Acinetobacter rudis]